MANLPEKVYTEPSVSAAAATAASVHIDGVTQAVRLSFKNEAACKIDLNWVDYSGNLRRYGFLNPGGTYVQNTFSTHPWCLTYSDGHEGRYVGESALLVAKPGGQLQVLPFQEPAEDSSWWKPEWGQYQQRGCVLGMPIMAFDCVGEEAVHQAVLLVEYMLAGTSHELLQRLVAASCKIAIIGRHQVTTDVPAHHFLRFRHAGEQDRDLDATTRGLGASLAVPTTSCGEENLTMVDDTRYPHENILIHELGHAVMTLGFNEQQTERIHRCYASAKEKKMYSHDCYMMENADEYWAEACQSWFDATIREDVNSGINTREKLKQHDPELAALLVEVLGDGSWRFPYTAPAPLQHRAALRDGKQQQQQEQQLSGAAAGMKHAAGKPADDSGHHLKRQRLQKPGASTKATAAASAAAATAAPSALGSRRVTFSGEDSSSYGSPAQMAGSTSAQTAAPGLVLADQRLPVHCSSRRCSRPGCRPAQGANLEEGANGTGAASDAGRMRLHAWRLGSSAGSSSSSWLTRFMWPCSSCCAWPFAATTAAAGPPPAVAVVPRSMLLKEMGQQVAKTS